MKEKGENKKIKIVFTIAIVFLLLDQITKIIAICTNVNVEILNNVLSFKLVFNNGIAFGIGQDKSIATFVVTNLIVLGLIMRFIWLQKDRMDTITMYGLFMILAGGFGNFIDRVFRGQVVDFIEIFPSTHFPVFNLADIYIVIGWIILAFMFAMYSYKEILNRKRVRDNK